MQSPLRTAFCAALAAAVAAQSAPAKAEFSYLSPPQAAAQRCHKTARAGDYQTSLQVCLSAAATFKALGDGEKRSPWYSYEVEGLMLEEAAQDYAALKRHREAYDTAVDAHHLLLYIYRTYTMDDDDRADIATVTARLARLEAAERSKI